MVYNSTYQASDMRFILTDLLGETGKQVVIYMGLIIAVFVVIFLISRFKRR